MFLLTFPQLCYPLSTFSLVSSSDVDGLKAMLLANMCHLQYGSHDRQYGSHDILWLLLITIRDINF